MYSFSALCFSDLGLRNGSRGPCGSWKLRLNTQNRVPGAAWGHVLIQVPGCDTARKAAGGSVSSSCQTTVLGGRRCWSEQSQWVVTY